MSGPTSQKVWREFAPGMVHGVFGPSGAGKTTWLREHIGLSRRPSCYPEDVAFLAQDPHLIPHDTIRRQVLWFGAREALEHWAPVLGLSEAVLDRYPNELSGGESQRAALLRVLVTERPVLVFDEPLSQVESTRRAAILKSLRTYVTEVQPHRRIILSSHHWDDLWLVSDTVSILENGVRIGPSATTTVYRNPPSPNIARLFGYIASIPCPKGGYWLIHPDLLGSDSHPGPGVRLSGTFHANRVGGSIRQWIFRCEEPLLELRWPSSAAFAPGSLTNHIRLIDPPWVPYHLDQEETL